MAKNMAVITDGIITNVIWCSDSEQETDTLKSPADRPVAIGDTYSDGKFYRDGVEILTQLEQALKELGELRNENEDLKTKSADMKQALDILGVQDV